MSGGAPYPPSLRSPLLMTLLIAIWLVLGALLILGLRPVLGGWGSPALVVWPVYVLLGLALAAASLEASLRPGPPPGRRSLRPLFLFALGGGILFAIHPWLARYSDTQVFRVRLARNQTAYDGLVTQLPTDSTSGAWRWHANLRYLVDSGPPLRLAVLQQGRGYDGDEVALYDPVGRLDTVRSAPGLLRPFGGRIAGCNPVLLPWYRCVLHARSR
jgi:hypothetical protein